MHTFGAKGTANWNSKHGISNLPKLLSPIGRHDGGTNENVATPRAHALGFAKFFTSNLGAGRRGCPNKVADGQGCGEPAFGGEFLPLLSQQSSAYPLLE
jgi:hypothetical protein